MLVGVIRSGVGSLVGRGLGRLAGCFVVVLGVLASVVVGVPLAPAEAAACSVGSKSGSDAVWFSDGSDLVADRLEDRVGLVLGLADAGFEWRVPVCVATDGSVEVIGSVAQVVSSEARADEQRALSAVLVGLQAGSQRPIPRIAPAVDEVQVAGLETWLAVDPGSYGDVLTGSQRAGDVAVSATATPVGLVWVFKTGSSEQELRCDGPGVLFSESALTSLGGPPCGWDWEHTTRVESAEMSVAIEYDVEWSSSVGSLGSLDGLRGRVLTSVSLTVDEIQSVGVWGNRNRVSDRGLPGGAVVDPGDCSLVRFAGGECDDFSDPAEDWGLPEACAEIPDAASGIWGALKRAGRATLNLGGEAFNVVFRGEDLDAAIEAGRGVLETAEGLAIGVVEVSGALWSCGSWAVGELYELLPPELRFLTDLALGCSKVGIEALQGVWDGVMMAASAADDFDAFVQEQTDMAMAVKEQVEADPKKFARDMLGGVFDEELFNENRNQWIGKMVCEVIIIVLSTVATGGAGIAARFGPKVAKVLDTLDDLIPDIPGRNKRRGCNSFPAGTLVLMADGSHTPIELVEPGDRVLTYDTDAGVWSGNVVLDQWSGLHAREMVTVTLGDGSSVLSTDDHLFWVSSQGEWVEADQLTSGDLLLTPDGVIVVDRVSIHDSEPVVVWELDTAIDDTFLVSGGGEASTLVHNAECTKPSGSKGDKPTGHRADETSGNAGDRRSAVSENQSADRLAGEGYKVEQLPQDKNLRTPEQDRRIREAQDQDGLKTSRDPDFIIEGKIFDNYFPTSAKTVDRIRDEISSKAKKGQAKHVVVDLSESSVSSDDLYDFLNKKIPGTLEEAIIIDSSGKIVKWVNPNA